MVRFILLLSTSAATGCAAGMSGTSFSSVSNDEDTSASGAAAVLVGGALGTSDQNGTFATRGSVSLRPAWTALFEAPRARATSTSECPTIESAHSTNANGCSTAGGVARLGLNGCHYGNGAGSWTGHLDVSFTGATAVTCGTFPHPTADVMLRQWTNSGGTEPGSASRTSPRGDVIVIDDTTAGIEGNYQGDAFNGHGASGLNVPSFGVGAKGGGIEIGFTAGKRSSVTILERIFAPSTSSNAWDHVIAGTVTIAETGSGAAKVSVASTGSVVGGRCTSGGVVVYQNVAKVLGRSCFQNVTFAPGCCTPVSGSITTSFSATSVSAGALATKMSGHSETITFAGCGSAALQDVDGARSMVALSHCL